MAEQTVRAFNELLAMAIAIVGGDAFDRRAQEAFGRLSINGDEIVLTWPRADDAMGYWLHLADEKARLPVRLLTANAPEIEAWRASRAKDAGRLNNLPGPSPATEP